MRKWPHVALRDVISVEREAVDPADIKKGTLYIGLENIYEDGTIRGVSAVQQGEIASTKFRFSSDQILYGKLRPYLRKISRPEFDGVCSTDILPLRPIGVDKGYVYHFLRQEKMVELATSRSIGMNLPRLRPNTLLEFTIPLPPLEEQRRIAAILDHAESLRAKREDVATRFAGLTEAAFHDLRRRHAQVSRFERLSSVATSMRTGPFGSQLLHSEFVESGVAVLGIDNVVQNRFVWAKPRFITEAKYAELQRYRVFPGDVLITIMATCGRCAVVPEKVPLAINTKHLCCITLDWAKCLPEYLQSCLLYDRDVLAQLGVHERGAVMPGLNMSVIGDLQIPLIPIDLQRDFAMRVQKIQSLQVGWQGRAEEGTVNLCRSLASEAFRGEL